MANSKIFFKSKTANWILGIFLFLVAFRICLPFIGLNVINYLLASKLENFEGKIEDFDLSLYRGAYKLDGFILKKRNSKVDPFITVKEIELSLSWKALFRKEITADIFINTIDIHVVESENKNERQTGQSEGNWQDVFKVIIPLNIESLTLVNSKIRFTNNSLKKPIPVVMDKIELKAYDLRTSRLDKADSDIFLNARLQKHAPLKLKGKVNILAVPFLGDIDLSLEKFDISSINDNLRYYVPVDITKGDLSLFGEVAIYSNTVKGYAKVFLTDADIIANDQKYNSFKHFLYEILIGVSNWFLKNSDTKEVATYIPFEGKRSGFEIDTSKLINSALDNKKKPLERKLDNSISL